MLRVSNSQPSLPSSHPAGMLNLRRDGCSFSEPRPSKLLNHQMSLLRASCRPLLVVLVLATLVACAGRSPVQAKVRKAQTTRSGLLQARILAPSVVRFSQFDSEVVSPMLQPQWQTHLSLPAVPTLQVESEEHCQAISTEHHLLLKLCASPEEQSSKLEFFVAGDPALFGLGQHFTSDGRHSLRGGQRLPGNEFGNRMVKFEGGAVGNTQIPVLYVLSEPTPFALFVDTSYALRWDFSQDPWLLSVHPEAPSPSIYVFAADNVGNLRRHYMALVGHAPVPPRKAFGFWLSEYGFDNWQEVDRKLGALRAAKFPLDGIVLDLQWFGGIEEDSEQSQMGSLSWDREAFPHPDAKLQELASQGIGVIAIEESYVAKGLDEHQDLSERGYLVVQKETGDPVYLDKNPWWGKGGMLDWTHPEARTYWHAQKRVPLVKAGLVGHWTDLGEPELFSPTGLYHGVEGFGRNQSAVHNFYNLLWAQGIADGYQQQQTRRRPFILTRSGTAGIQRFGAAMWSGDIGSNFESLHAHLFAQSHMSFSGIDYYGTDIGGFKRSALRGDLDELYTQWFANAMMFDIPARAHVLNLCNCHPVSPHEVGDIVSNRANAERRYQLISYLYSLAHHAFETGDPVIAPLVFHYPEDKRTHALGTHKQIGQLLAVGVAREGAQKEDVYLPAGEWFAWDGSSRVASRGQWLRDVPLRPSGRFTLPLFAQAGAIVPLDRVQREPDGRGARRVRVFAGPAPTRFVLVEDDGETLDYQNGATRRTMFTQQRRGPEVHLSVHALQTESQPPTAAYQFELAGVTAVTQVLIGDKALPQRRTARAFERARSGWLDEPPFVHIKTGALEVQTLRVMTDEKEQQ